MSVPGLNGVAPDVATAVRLAQSAAPQPSSSSGASAPATQPEDTAARAALNEYLNGAAPSDVSIGLYSAAPDSAAAITEDVQANDIQRQDMASDALASATLAADLSQQQAETAIVQQNQVALAEIENSLNAALVEAKQTFFVAGLLNLTQAVEAGASEEAVAFADKLQAAQQGASGLDLAALPALLQNLIATTQSGDMAAAAFLARAIRMRMQETSGALPPAREGTLPPPDVAADPLLQAYQMSLLIGVRTTLNKLRKLRDDRMKFRPILALEESRLRQDGYGDE